MYIGRTTQKKAAVPRKESCESSAVDLRGDGVQQCEGDGGSCLRRNRVLPREALPWTKLFPDATIQAVELLESSLMLNPADRPTAQEALQYSFFGDAETLYDYSLDYLKPSPTNFFEFEMAKITVPVLKEMIDNEVLLSSATNYRKPSIPTITVPSLRGRDRDQQPLSHPHSDSQTSRTDITSMSTAINPASSSHSSASTGGLASHAAMNQPPRRNQPQMQS